jgi:hypothetical protein
VKVGNVALLPPAYFNTTRRTAVAAAANPVTCCPLVAEHVIGKTRVPAGARPGLTVESKQVGREPDRPNE